MTTTQNPPTISVNKLAEYMTANAIRRRQIVRDAKNPLIPKFGRYRDARETLCQYVISQYDEAILAQAIERLRATTGSTSWQEDDREKSIMALEMAQAMEFPDISEFDITLFDEQRANMTIGGVLVRVNPNLILHHRTNGKVGVMKIHLAKTAPLSPEALKYVATITRQYMENRGGLVIDPNACIATDIFTGSHAMSPSTFKRVMNQVVASCEEFSLHWDSLE